MQTHWFYTVWPFIGVGGAIVMVAILLTTDTFRGGTKVSRWRDPMWLAWLAVPLYWLHQFEEYPRWPPQLPPPVARSNSST